METFELLNGSSAGVGGSDLQQKIRLAEEKVASLQEVIKKLQMTKKFLHLNAVEVKASIHSNISRLLESMRNREVFLLHQVDVILEAKEERLRGQEDQLNQAIGRLSNCLSLLDGGTSLSTELNDILSRIDSHGKHPVESPHICFRADMPGLRQAVHEFGRVDSKGLPLEAFASPHVRSSSLPKPFEDYEDDEHHVFYKTVHEIHEKKHGKSIIFNIPKLSTNIPSWVSPTHQPFETKNPFGSSSQPAVGLKSKSAMINAERKKPTTACTISQWMQEIKMEEEDDEFMTSQLTSKYGNKGLVTSASDSSLISGSRSEAPKMSSEKIDMKPWLSQSANAFGTKNEGAQSSMFSFLSTRLQDWLVDGEARLPKTKMVDSLPTFEPFVFKPSSDVKENVLENHMKRMAAKPLDFWLASSAKTPKLESETGSNPLESYAKNADLLPWLSSSPGFLKEPVLESGIETGTGIIENHAKRIANLAWLARGKEAESMSDPTNVGLNSSLESKGSEEGLLESCLQKFASKSWLLDEQESLPDNSKTFFSDHFMNIYQLPTSHWLLSSSSSSLPSSLPLPTSETDSHLDQRTTGQEEKLDQPLKDAVVDVSESGFEKCIKALNLFPVDHWLLRTSVENLS